MNQCQWKSHQACQPCLVFRVLGSFASSEVANMFGGAMVDWLTNRHPGCSGVLRLHQTAVLAFAHSAVCTKLLHWLLHILPFAPNCCLMPSAPNCCLMPSALAPNCCLMPSAPNCCLMPSAPNYCLMPSAPNYSTVSCLSLIHI